MNVVSLWVARMDHLSLQAALTRWTHNIARSMASAMVSVQVDRARLRGPMKWAVSGQARRLNDLAWPFGPRSIGPRDAS
jgi:hypothetical protein